LSEGERNITAENPFISIIIPARNEELHIRSCLDSLLDQDYKGEFEIIVVDGVSDDSTRSIVSEVCRRDKRVMLISNPARITPVAMNLGVRAAGGEILGTVGADWQLTSDFLSNVAMLFKKYGADCMGGQIIREVESDQGNAIELARESIIGGGLSIRNDPTVREQIVERPNLAFVWRRSVFERVGLFDERLKKNQDNEFNIRALRAGFKTLYSPRFAFRYHPPQTFRKLARQMFDYASYTPMMILKHRRFLNAAFSIPAIAFLAWSALLMMGISKSITMIVPLLLLGCYFLVIVFAAITKSYQGRKPKYWLVICLSFFTIHMAVNLGYLYGIIRLLKPSLSISLWREYKTISSLNNGTGL
jgi:glycosyltransferase involved in cell wall biosynthesis